MVDTAERYRLARERVTAIVETLDEGDLARPVPTCPGWSVHDLIAHLSGIVDDALAGRLEGRGTPPWTAAQVERGRGVPVEQLMAGWSEQAPTFEQLRLPAPAAIDILTHEQDLRGAVGRPGARDTEALAWAFDLGAQRAVAEVPGLRIETGDGAGYGPTDAPVTVVGERYELFRVFLGRRSAGQLERLEWRGGIPADAGKIMLFGPATVDILE